MSDTCLYTANSFAILIQLLRYVHSTNNLMNSNISNKVKKSDFVVNKYSLRLGKKEPRKLQLYFNGDILLYTVNMNNHNTVCAALAPYKMEISQKLYEVYFSYDNVYYTHCYHEVIKSYDTGNHLIDTRTEYHQSVGG